MKKRKKEEDFDDDDCKVCKLMRTGNPTPEELMKAMSLQNFLNDNFPNGDDSEQK